ncbi:DUF2892 domain-containing protein [Marinobacter koreensis]|jgi:hypothetical protein|uniref:DUF2892 domain-containing protein n=1 Tax=Marinobacter koreensis TaxID=335974 RepID=A0ABW0RKT0_9GAMM|nr:DUF2892 domain-containing protein [Marinobacter koreensis]MCK7546547.1 DUF2892 domain-containing protein [Marinobacter koreensis]
MTVNEGLRLMAGVFTLISILLAHYVSPYWLFFTAFIALNLIQSAFTKWCPAMAVLRKLGFKEEKPVT